MGDQFSINKQKNMTGDNEITGSIRLDPLPDSQLGITKSISGRWVFPNIRKKEQPTELLEHTESPAILYIINEHGNAEHLTNKFYLTSIQESHQEKSQIIETFGKPSFFFYGERAKIYNFAGTMLETKATRKKVRHKYLWATSFTNLYNEYLRGTKLVENRQEAVLAVKNSRFHGYVLNLNIIHDANAPQSANFSFSMIVREQTFLIPTTGANLPGESNTNDLYSVNQFAANEKIHDQLVILSDTIAEASNALLEKKGVNDDKISLIEEVKKEVTGAIDIMHRNNKSQLGPSNNVAALNKVVTKGIDEHLDWIIFNGTTDGIGEAFLGKDNKLNTLMDSVYATGVGQTGFIEAASTLNDALKTYNEVLTSSYKAVNEYQELQT